MYYKIKDNVLFRQYNEYGYITDNSMFGYRMLNDITPLPGEKYVSESGAVMFSVLSCTPQYIDDIVKKLLGIFVDIEFYELKKDVIEFLDYFVDEGFLLSGATIEECNNCGLIKEFAVEQVNPTVAVENCAKNVFNQNDFLRSIHIEIANECNERCVHCYIPHEYKTKVIDSELFYRIIEEGRVMNIINVTLSGGEPLIHGDFLSFLAKCRELDLSVNVLSNLTLLTDEIIDEMKKNPLLSVQTSIYSMDSAVHDSITKVKGSFEKTKNGVLKLYNVGIPLQISCPIMKQNKDTFADVINWGKELNIAVLIDYVIFASYDHNNCNLVNRLSLEEVSNAVDKQLLDDYVTTLCEIAKEKCELTGADPVCSICRYYLCVSAEGDIYPCIGWQNNKIGNLNSQSLKEIWEQSKEIQRLRQIKLNSFPKCVDCNDIGYCNVCMMSNSNENSDGDEFKINDFNCKVASMIHSKVDSYLKMNRN